MKDDRSISLNAALDAVDLECEEFRGIFGRIEKRIKALPSAQLGWIPCSTALPKDEEEVIVSIHDDSGDYACDYTSSGWYAAAGEFWVVDNETNMRVTAWMPLPEPWKGGRDEQN